MRHPDNSGWTRNITEELARGLQARIAPPGSALATVAELGWRPDLHVERGR